MNKTLFIKEDFPFMKKEVNDMTKAEQLKVAFKKELFEAFDKVVPKNRLLTGSIAGIIEETANVMLKEVSIRTDLR